MFFVIALDRSRYRLLGLNHDVFWRKLKYGLLEWIYVVFQRKLRFEVLVFNFVVFLQKVYSKGQYKVNGVRKMLQLLKIALS